VPVMSTGGYQKASLVRDGLQRGDFDGVTIARALIANPDLLDQWRSGKNEPDNPCTFCNKCLVNAPKNPLGCLEPARFPSKEAMIEEIMSVYEPRPQFVVPELSKTKAAQPAEVG